MTASARDRAIEIITSELPRGQAYVSPHVVDALRAHPEVLRALAGEAGAADTPPAAAPDLTEAEGVAREWLPAGRDGRAIFRVMAEYDRRGTELTRVRAAVTALADELDGMAPARMSSPDVAARLRETLGQP